MSDEAPDGDIREEDGELLVKIDGEYISVEDADIEVEEDADMAMRPWGRVGDSDVEPGERFTGSFDVEFDADIATDAVERLTERMAEMGTLEPEVDEIEMEMTVGTDPAESVRERFAELDVPVAHAFVQLAEEVGTRRARTELMTDRHTDPFLGDDSTPVTEDATFDTYTLEASPEMTEELFRRIAERIEEREREGHDIEQLVLGLPQYEAILPWTQQEYGRPPEEVLPVDDLIVVPGPQIHPVIDPKRLMMEERE